MITLIVRSVRWLVYRVRRALGKDVGAPPKVVTPVRFGKRR